MWIPTDLLTFVGGKLKQIFPMTQFPFWVVSDAVDIIMVLCLKHVGLFFVNEAKTDETFEKYSAMNKIFLNMVF